jgi:hypothetical protein
VQDLIQYIEPILQKIAVAMMSTYTQKISVVDDVAPIIVPLNGTLATMSSGDTIVTYCGADEYPQWLNLPVNQLIKGVDACSSNPTINLTGN